MTNTLGREPVSTQSPTCGEFDRASAEVGVEAVLGDRCTDGRDPGRELVEGQLDVDRDSLLRRPERLAEAEAFVEATRRPTSWE